MPGLICGLAFFYDKRKHRLYCMIPFVGFYIQFKMQCECCKEYFSPDEIEFREYYYCQCPDCIKYQFDDLSEDLLQANMNDIPDEDLPF